MNKYKLLRFGHCYISREGDIAISLLGGDKRSGYDLTTSYAHPAAWMHELQILTRIVPNDGTWIEIDHATFFVASTLHVTGYVMVFPSEKSTGEPPLIYKKY